MKVVKITYTVKKEYAIKNQENINEVMEDLRNLKNPNILYAAYLGEDGKTFTHFGYFEEEGFQQVLINLESFKTFQQQLKASGLEEPIKQEAMKVVSSSYDIFKSKF